MNEEHKNEVVDIVNDCNETILLSSKPLILVGLGDLVGEVENSRHSPVDWKAPGLRSAQTSREELHLRLGSLRETEPDT